MLTSFTHEMIILYFVFLFTSIVQFFIWLIFLKKSLNISYVFDILKEHLKIQAIEENLMQLKCVKTCRPWQDMLSFCSRKAWRSISFLWNIIGTSILQSSFNLFPKSTLPNCKIYNANFLLGYFAELTSFCQIHFVTLWSSHCRVHVAKSTFPSC